MRRWRQIISVKRVPSKLINNQLIFCQHTSNPRLQAVKTFWPDFAPLKFVRGPDLTYSTILVKTFEGQEKNSFLIFRPHLNKKNNFKAE